MLDDTMAYSCGIFERPDSTLAAGLTRQIRCRLPQARAAAIAIICWRSAPAGAGLRFMPRANTAAT